MPSEKIKSQVILNNIKLNLELEEDINYLVKIAFLAIH